MSILRVLAPLALAVLTFAAVLLVIGASPDVFFSEVLRFGLLGNGWQNSLNLLAPLLVIGSGLIIAFRAGFWNLGFDGQFLLPAVIVAGFGPALTQLLPVGLALFVLIVLALIVGALWALVPALLKVRNNANEVVTTLMMSFIAIGIANLLIRGVFSDPNVLVPQTRVIAQDALLPFIGNSRIHVGVLVAVALVIVAQIVLTKTSLGVRIDVLGASPRVARHIGLRNGLLTILVFVLSGAAIGLAGALDMLGVWGYARTDFNPAYGIAVIPFVLIARLNPIGSVPLLAFYAVFATGATVAAQNAGISIDLLLVMDALLLAFLALTEWVVRRSVTRREKRSEKRSERVVSRA